MTKTKQNYLYEKPSEMTFYENPTHANILMHGLNALREKGELFDITLIIEGTVFRAHKAVLAASSDYFRAMFTDNMLEAKQNEICLNGITAKGFQHLLEYAYTSSLGLNVDNVQDILEAASHVQMSHCVQACANFLQSQIELDNCVDIATIAETYSLLKLRMKVYRFMSGHLLRFSKTSEFYRLTPLQLENLLSYDFPVDCSEADVLRIVLTWFFHVDNHELDVRITNAVGIIKYIHFKEISRRKLDSILDKVFEGRKYEWHFLYGIVLQEVYIQSSTETSVDVSLNLLNSRGMELAVLKIGGFGISGVTNEITYTFETERKWKHLTSIPHVEQCNYGTAVFNNELYIIGGCFNQSLQENIHPFGFKYSPSFLQKQELYNALVRPHLEYPSQIWMPSATVHIDFIEKVQKWFLRFNKWSTLSPMTVERCRFSLNILDGKLYAVGGNSEVEEYDLSTCEYYDPRLDVWTMIPDLPAQVSQHAGVGYEYKGKLFVSGGIDRDGKCMKRMYCYDVRCEWWNVCAPMLKPRADHVMIAVEKFLYVCGGWTEEQGMRSRALIDTIDVYDIENNCWEILTKVPNPRFHAGIVFLDQKIYFVGGFHSDAMFDKDIAAIEYYDLKSNTWTTEAKYPQDIWEHTCATLYIPKCRDDMEVIPTTACQV